MASGPMTLWQIDGEKVETVTDFIFLASKITVDGDCSHEIKRHFLLGSKAMSNLDGVLKSRDMPLLTKDKGLYSQSYGFSGSHVWKWELDNKEKRTEKLLLSNCGAGEDSWESLGQQRDQISQS